MKHKMVSKINKPTNKNTDVLCVVKWQQMSPEKSCDFMDNNFN